VPVGISQICTPLRKYAIVCIDNLTKNNFARESQTEQTIRLFAATVMAGLDQGSPKKNPDRTRSASSRDAGERRGECLRPRTAWPPCVK